jgi:hypothetical protein
MQTPDCSHPQAQNTQPQKKGHGFGPSAVDSICGEEIEGTPHGKTLTGTRVPQQRAMSIMGRIQAGPGKTKRRHVKGCHKIRMLD